MEINMSRDIRIANEDDLPAIQILFEQWGKAFQHSIDDQEYVAAVEGKIVGALRLSFENSVFILRGLYIDEKHRGCGLARELLNLAHNELGIAEAYCLCPRSLQAPFVEIGFQQIAGLTAPSFLTDRRDRLRESNGDVILMRRSAGIEVRPITVDD